MSFIMKMFPGRIFVLYDSVGRFSFFVSYCLAVVTENRTFREVFQGEEFDNSVVYSYFDLFLFFLSTWFSGMGLKKAWIFGYRGKEKLIFHLLTCGVGDKVRCLVFWTTELANRIVFDTLNFLSNFIIMNLLRLKTTNFLVQRCIEPLYVFLFFGRIICDSFLT